MAMENQYFILRHGESLKNVRGFESCWPEKRRVPLTVKGRKQINQVAKKAKKEKIDLIFASDLLRTKQTALIVGKELKLKPKSDKRLREVNIGDFNGQPIEIFGKFWNDGKRLSPLEHYARRYKIPAPHGENYKDVEERLLNFIKEMEKRYKDKNILIVSHQRPLTLLEKAVCGYDFKKMVRIIKQKKEIKIGDLRKLKLK